MKDAQASFQILRLSAVSRLSYLLRTVPPSIMHQAAAGYDALVEWALASIIAGDGAVGVWLPTTEEVANDPSVCQDQTYLGDAALRQAHLPIREGGLGLTSSDAIKGAAYIGCHALVLGRVVAASARGDLPSLLERLPERPMASALLEELRTVAKEVKASQVENAVGASWAALAEGMDPGGRGVGTLLTEAGAEGGREGGEQQKQGGDPSETQSEEENRSSRAGHRVRGGHMGVAPRVQSRLSRVLHAHHGVKLLTDDRNQEGNTSRRAMVRFRGAREKGTMTFVECQGISQEEIMEGCLWRETLGTSLRSHDAADPVGGMCYGNGCREETTRLHTILCSKTGWSSLTHN